MLRPSEPRLSIRASSRVSRAALMVRRSGPDGIGTSSCQRMLLPRDSTPPFVVAGARPRKARLQEIVRRELEEARAQHTVATDQHARHRRAEIVVKQAMRNEAEVLEGAHVPIEEADLILARIEPGEIAPRVHQAQEEHPRLAPLAGDVDEDLEEVDLAEIARFVHKRNEHLLAPAFPLRDHLADHAVAHHVALRGEQLVEARGRQLLLASGPARCLPKQLLEPRPYPLLDRARTRYRHAHAWRRSLDVAPDCVA